MTGFPNVRYKWVIVAASFFSMTFNSGVNYVVGVLHLGLVEAYPEDEHAVVWLSSLFGSVYALSGPISSLVINCFDCRTCAVIAGVLGMLGFTSSCFVHSLSWLFVTYAIVISVGHGMSLSASNVILGYYFTDDVSVASGIAVTGSALAIFIHPPLASFLMTSYGLQTTFLILGAITLQSCVFGMLFRPSKFERCRRLQLRSGRERKQTFLKIICGNHVSQFGNILTNVPFLLLLFSVLTASINIISVYLYLPDYFVQSGASQHMASFSVSMSGIGSAISRILTGFAANDPRIGCSLLLAGLMGISGVVTACIRLFSTTTAGQLTFGFLFGLYTSGLWVILGPIVIHILGVEMLSLGYGIVMFTVGIGCLIGPTLSGLVYKVTDHYFSIFLFCAVLCFISSMCCFLMSLTLSRRHTPVNMHKVNLADLDVDIQIKNTDLELSIEINNISDNVSESEEDHETTMLKKNNDMINPM